MKPSLVHFSSQPRPFRVNLTFCANAECDCAEVMFHLREVIEPGSVVDPIRFDIRMDGRTWEEIAPPQWPDEIASLVQEFLRDYPASEKAAILARCDQKWETARRIREHRFTQRQMDEALLVAFNEIASVHGSIATGGSACTYLVEHGGVEYPAEDLYCPNPDCECREVHLTFFRYRPSERSPGNVVLEDLFSAVVPFSGAAKVNECYRCKQGDAEQILAAWQQQYADDLERLESRYEVIKKIGLRSLTRRATIPRQHDVVGKTAATAAPRVGRNDPCPCGSGKKFKKCCGLNKAPS